MEVHTQEAGPTQYFLHMLTVVAFAPLFPQFTRKDESFPLSQNSMFRMVPADVTE